jgi:L-2-hydroxyglutarate oxidase LhgO
MRKTPSETQVFPIPDPNAPGVGARHTRPDFDGHGTVQLGPDGKPILKGSMRIGNPTEGKKTEPEPQPPTNPHQSTNE